jgi:uncharacterized surface protein with fasciclin (FAS1) repeats
MKKLTAALLAACLCSGSAAASEEIRFHGKSVMFSTNSIVSNLLASREHTKLMKAMRSVGLEQPLLYQGSFTLFAPDDEAFAKLPADFSESIFRRVNRSQMAKLLACHIVMDQGQAGQKLLDRMKPGAPLLLPTLGGCVLKLELKDGVVLVTDESGNQARIIEADILQTNGLIELTDRVFVPKN